MCQSSASNRRRWPSSLALGLLGAIISAAIGTVAHVPSVQAAEKLVITYGPFNAALAIQDLETLVNTEEVPGSLRFYLGLADLDPDLLRNLLAMELGASSEFMSGMLESESGQQLLSQVSDVIHLPPNQPQIHVLKSAEPPSAQPSQTENIEALHTALLNAAADRRVTVLEVLQHYPAEKVYLDAAKLIRFANQLESDAAQATIQPAAQAGE
jgi:Alpha/beta hydrolase of unknown function (DUF1400)